MTNKQGSNGNLPCKRRRTARRMCPTKTAAFHGLLGERFQREGDVENASFHYERSLEAFGASPELDDDSMTNDEVENKFIPPQEYYEEDDDDTTMPHVIVDDDEMDMDDRVPSTRRLSDFSTESSVLASPSDDTRSKDYPEASFVPDIAEIDQCPSPKSLCVAAAHNLASLSYLHGRLRQCHHLYDQIEELLSDADHDCPPSLFANVANNVGYLHALRGEYELASDSYASSLVEYWSAAGGEREDAASARLMFGLARCQYELGMLADSAENYREATSMWRRDGTGGAGVGAADVVAAAA